ncbi:YncE family protein [Roseomonas marmotae]|uniref:YncE family protein n=1 Tax=Roseomonas marmotae TaxID=2768161 RepID=A0ABS3KAT9_9PROT|nr:YncE family protein [Roseomonas marmotae]MBO1074562.1 YncE family protein [Roseomonas marmotae]QTI81594.1 YncE family protein [Roseomonas marmotae]
MDTGPTRPNGPRNGAGFPRRRVLGLLAATLAAGAGFRAAAAATAGGEAPAVLRSARVYPGLYEVVVSRATGLVHVAATGPRGANAARILGLDPQSLEVRSQIELGDEPAFGLGLNDVTGVVYTSNTRSGTVSAIDLKAGKVLATLSGGEGGHPRQLLVDEAANRVYVSNFGSRGKPSAIWVIDGTTNTLAGVITEGLAEGGITGLTLDKAGNRLFATALTSNEVVEISLAGGGATRRFPSGGEGPINLAFDPAGQRLFVTNQKSNTLTVLDAATGALVKSLPTGEGPLGVALSPARGLVYVACRRSGTVELFNARDLAPLSSLQTGTHPNTIAIDPRSGLAYVTNKARSGGRGAPPVDDPDGDTVSIIRA